MFLARLSVNSKLPVKFWGNQSYMWIFNCVGGRHSTQSPCCSSVNCINSLRLYFVLNSVFALVELHTVSQKKGKKLSAARRKGWLPTLYTGTSSLPKIHSQENSNHLLNLMPLAIVLQLKKSFLFRTLNPFFSRLNFFQSVLTSLCCIPYSLESSTDAIGHNTV